MAGETRERLKVGVGPRYGEDSLVDWIEFRCETGVLGRSVWGRFHRWHPAGVPAMTKQAPESPNVVGWVFRGGGAQVVGAVRAWR
jgi:hypothetical protein